MNHSHLEILQGKHAFRIRLLNTPKDYSFFCISISEVLDFNGRLYENTEYRTHCPICHNVVVYYVHYYIDDISRYYDCQEQTELSEEQVFAGLNYPICSDCETVLATQDVDDCIGHRDAQDDLHRIKHMYLEDPEIPPWFFDRKCIVKRDLEIILKYFQEIKSRSRRYYQYRADHDRNKDIQRKMKTYLQDLKLYYTLKEEEVL